MMCSNTSGLKTIIDFINGIKVFVVLILLVFFLSGTYFYIRKIRKN